MDTKALPKGSLILVTGVNGYIGSHVADKLLGLGYRVKGTARDEKKLKSMMEVLKKRNPETELQGVIVPDMQSQNAFHDAVQGCHGVIHVASDVSFGSDPNKVVTATVEGMRNALAAAASVPSVKRFVYTSSSIASATPRPNTVFYVDTNSWNEEATKLAWAPPPYEPSRAVSVYGASKVESERLAWDFSKDANFVFNAVLPNFNIGRILDPSQSASSAGFVAQIFAGNDTEGTRMFARLPPQHQINVEDCALIHVAALLETDVKNERLFAFNHQYNFADIVEILKKINPSKPDFPEPPNEDRDLSVVANGRALELLQRYGRDAFTDLEESLRQMFDA